MIVCGPSVVWALGSLGTRRPQDPVPNAAIRVGNLRPPRLGPRRTCCVPIESRRGDRCCWWSTPSRLVCVRSHRWPQMCDCPCVRQLPQSPLQCPSRPSHRNRPRLAYFWSPQHPGADTGHSEPATAAALHKVRHPSVAGSRPRIRSPTPRQPRGGPDGPRPCRQNPSQPTPRGAQQMRFPRGVPV